MRHGSILGMACNGIFEFSVRFGEVSLTSGPLDKLPPAIFFAGLSLAYPDANARSPAIGLSGSPWPACTDFFHKVMTVTLVWHTQQAGSGGRFGRWAVFVVYS